MPDTAVLETSRLALRKLSAKDAAFILALLNDPDWLRFIGDRGVRTLEGARQYIRDGPMASYRRFGFGMYRVDRKEDGTAIGICGLVKRDALDDVDIGYALLPQHRGKGYAAEAASAVLDFGRRVLGLRRIVAITAPDNQGSIRILETLGLKFEKPVRLSPDDEEISLFATGA